MTPHGVLEFTRKYPRVNLELLADFTIISESEKEQSETRSSFIKTLGGGGVMLVSLVPLPEGSVIKMQLYYETTILHFEAEVVWTELVLERDQQEYKVGLKFTNISDNDRAYLQYILYKYLHSNPEGAA